MGIGRCWRLSEHLCLLGLDMTPSFLCSTSTPVSLSQYQCMTYTIYWLPLSAFEKNVFKNEPYVVIEVKISNLDAPATDVTLREKPSTDPRRTNARTTGCEAKCTKIVGMINQNDATAAVRIISTYERRSGFKRKIFGSLVRCRRVCLP